MLVSLNQTRLRNRIAAVSFVPTDGNSYQSATHYSYDIHGNVKRLVQDIPAISSFDRRFTSLDYEYDLISGNVNRVWYQKGKLEQFSHRYRYDADNRVTHVYTSNIFKVKRDSTVSQERLEARYFYLPTGALSRIELGHKQIQGIDYAYTLQGWLKDINGYGSLGRYLLDRYDSYDIGNDGVIQTDNVNRLFAHDGYTTSIQYFQGDYTPVAGSNYFNDYSQEAVPLYNGNISALSESIYNLWNRGILKLFRYDKLNRIKRMRTAAHHFEGSGWETPSDNFATDYTYDWNGNLLSLRRKNQYGEEMHDIRYTYPNGNNRLGSIAATGISSSVYQYDALGNLVRDNAEGLTVGWNALGKVDTIRRNGNLLSAFRYSPTGQRQVKTDSSGTAFYIHDATGNVMCIYRQDGDTLRATERYLYGSKRLGMLEQQVWIAAGGVARLQDASTIGARVYEFTDHLGNVTYTAQDRKYLVPDSYGQLQYLPSTVTYTDYYPFGFPMPGRSFANGGYRYFFNGQEADNEVLEEGGFQNYSFRMYDTRIARFWGVDPLAKDYPMLTPFQFASCSPMLLVDVDGLEGIENTIGYTSDGVPFRYFNARQSTYVKPKTLPEVELKRPLFHVATKQQLPFVGEIRPALSEYEKAWVESAGYFGTYIYLDPIVRATAAGGLVVTAGLFGQYAASDVLPYAVRSGEQLYSLGLNVYNNPWGKRAIGIGLGYAGHKQEWSPDVTFSDPTIDAYSLLSQFLFDTWEKNKELFDDKRRIDVKTFPQNTNNNAKSNNTKSTEKKD